MLAAPVLFRGLHSCRIKASACLQGAVMQACGHMYLDEGEELSTGTAQDNLLSFSAFTAAGGNGTTGQVIRHLRIVRRHLLTIVCRSSTTTQGQVQLVCDLDIFRRPLKDCVEQHLAAKVQSVL